MNIHTKTLYVGFHPEETINMDFIKSLQGEWKRPFLGFLHIPSLWTNISDDTPEGLSLHIFKDPKLLTRVELKVSRAFYISNAKVPIQDTIDGYILKNLTPSRVFQYQSEFMGLVRNGNGHITFISHAPPLRLDYCPTLSTIASKICLELLNVKRCIVR